jgi:hypothetical protein
MCSGCGEQWRPLRNLRALTPELRGCRDCLWKAGVKALGTSHADPEETLRYGRRAMRLAANLALSVADPPKLHSAFQKCGHCGGRVLPSLDGKTTPAWCGECEAERRQYGNPAPPELRA